MPTRNHPLEVTATEIPLHPPELSPPALPSAPSPTALPPILTTTEAAALLRLNRKTLYDLVRRNQLPGARKLGRSLRFDRDSLLRWMRAEPPHC